MSATDSDGGWRMSCFFNCTDLLLITDHENGEEKRGDLMVRIVDIVTWLLESPKEKGPALFTFCNTLQ